MTKTHTFAKAFIVATALIAVTGPTFAQGKERGQRASFEQLDSDGSGEITLAEMQAAGLARFAAADANGDGLLTKEELIVRVGTRGERRIDQMLERRDANNDGMLSTAELRPNTDRTEARFARLDTDESGGISKAEFEAQKARRGDRRKPATE